MTEHLQRKLGSSVWGRSHCNCPGYRSALESVSGDLEPLRRISFLKKIEKLGDICEYEE